MNFFSTGAFSITKNTNDVVEPNQLQDSLGNPINITGYTFFFTAKERPYSEGCAIFKIQTTHSNAVNGQTFFPIYPQDTKYLPPGKYYYEITSKDPIGNYTSWENDAFFIQQSIKSYTTGSASGSNSTELYPLTFCAEAGTLSEFE